MENKKAFVVYTNWKQYIDELTDEEVGMWTRWMFDYCNDKWLDKEIEYPNNSAVKVLCKLTKDILKQDLVKYKNKKKRIDDINERKRVERETKSQQCRNDIDNEIVNDIDNQIDDSNKLLVISNKIKEVSKDTNNNIVLSNSNELSNNNYSKKDDELNKFIINNINGGSDDVDDVANAFFEKISNTHFVRHATKALSISAEVFLQNAKIIIAEWKLLGLINFLPENTPEKHLINQMRIKRDLPAELKAQAGAKERQNKITENKIKEEQIQRESTELRGSAALAAFRQSKGLSENENIISMIGVTSEAEAIRDVRTIIAQS
jgi:hypothetical protein